MASTGPEMCVLFTIEFQINSPEDITINARADDNVIEGIEIPSHRFYLGVQWHPEFFLQTENPHMNLFLALITAAKL